MDGQRRYRHALAEAREVGKPQSEVITEMNRTFKWVSVVLALITSIMAGGAVSANIIPTLDAGVKQTLFIILSVLMAFASVLAFTTGEMLGMMTEEAKAKAELVGLDYKAEVRAWEEERENFWLANRKRYMKRIDPELMRGLEAEKTQTAAQATGKITIPQATEVLDWYLTRHKDLTLNDRLSAKVIAVEAMDEVYKNTDIKPDPKDVENLASGLRVALLRSLRGDNGNKPSHRLTEFIGSRSVRSCTS